MERGEELFVQFPAAEMKPLHAKWIAESLEFYATQQVRMENALRGVGIWDILQGTFEPDALLAEEFWHPAVVTAEEAAEAHQGSDSEYEFVENSEDEADPQDNFVEEEDEVDYNLEDEVSSDGNRTPVFGSPNHGEETESEPEIQKQPIIKRRRTVLEESDDDSNAGNLKEDYPAQTSIPETQMSATNTPSKRTRTSRTSRAIQLEEEEVQRAIAESIISLSQTPRSASDFLQPEEGECIDEEQTSLFLQKLLQEGQWRVVYLDEAWQLAKRLLLPATSLPPRTRKHPSQHSYIVPRNVLPSKVTKIKADGACMFGALSFALFRTEDCHRAVREAVLQHMATIWDKEERVRLFAAMFYQQKTGLLKHVRPSDVNITCLQYIHATKMDLLTFGEVARSWRLQPVGYKHQSKFSTVETPSSHRKFG